MRAVTNIRRLLNFKRAMCLHLRQAGGSKKGALIIRSAVDGNTDGDYLDAEDYLLIDIKVQN